MLELRLAGRAGAMSRQLREGLPVSLAYISAELQEAFSQELDSYVESLKGRERPSSFKVINDPIWLTIRVESWELVVLDSPLIQRLRNIHQLGLAGLIYPAAGYSRFEHTIGTLFQAQRVIESVNRNARAHRAVLHETHDAETISRHRMEDWLLQFAKEEIPLAVSLLRHIRYWSRARFVDVFAAAISDWAKGADDDQWVPLGGPTTSSHYLTYLWPDLKERGTGPRRVLSSAEQLQAGGSIIFFDDNVGLGNQGKTVLQQWLGVDREEWALDEEHVDRLPDEKLKILRNTRIKFLFATGRRSGLRALITSAKSLLKNSEIEGYVIVPEEMSCFQSSSGVFGAKSDTERAKEVFRAVGERALSDRRNGWPKRKFEDRLLGYGNSGGLNVFYYNVPTTTVTALWKSSNEAGASWMGLFPRRRRE